MATGDGGFHLAHHAHGEPFFQLVDIELFLRPYQFEIGFSRVADLHFEFPVCADLDGNVRFRIAERKLRLRAPVDLEFGRFGHKDDFDQNVLRFFALGIENAVAAAVEGIHHLPVFQQNGVMRFGYDDFCVGIEAVGALLDEKFVVIPLIRHNKIFIASTSDRTRAAFGKDRP